MKKYFFAVLAATFAMVICAHSTHANEVGFSRLTVDDPMGGKMQVSVWYPTNAPAKRVKLGPYAFNAARDAPPLEGLRGLVILSHGTEGSDLGHRNIGIELARLGMIAAAPLHPRDNFKDNSGVGQRVVMEGRPRQISAVIDALKADPIWAPYINPHAIGAFGFSLGGYTVLAALGAEPDMTRIVAHCEEQASDPFCSFAGANPATLRQRIRDEFLLPMLALEDRRLCAASIADPVAVVFSDAALSGITARHIQIWRPEEENVLASQFHGSRVVQQLNTRSDVSITPEHVVKGAQHYSFLAPFPWRLNWVLPSELTRDASGFDRTSFQAQFAKDVARFMFESLQDCGNIN